MATSRPFAYNTGSTITGTEQVGLLAVGTPTSGFSSTGLPWWNGPDEDLGYVIAGSVSGNTQPTPVSGVTASVGFWRSSAVTDASFIQLTNNLFNQSFITAYSTSNYLTTNGYWNSWVKPAPNIVFLSRLDSNATNTTYTLSVAGAANRIALFAVAINEKRNISSFTINGVSATLGATIQGTTGGTVAIYYRDMPTSGATSASVTFDSSATGCNLMYFEISNYNEPAHVASNTAATSGGSVSINDILENDLVFTIGQASFCPTSIDSTSQSALTSPGCLTNDSKTRVFSYTMPSNGDFNTTISTTPSGKLNVWAGVVFR